MTLKTRIAKLEAKQPLQAKRVVVVDETEISPEELQALRNDKSIGTLFIICHDYDDKPISEIHMGDYSARVGIDFTKL